MYPKALIKQKPYDMLKIKLFSVLFFLLAGFASLSAQTKMEVMYSSDSSNSYLLSTIQKQTFSNGKMIIVFNDETNSVEIDLSKQVKVVFSDSTSAVNDSTNKSDDNSESDSTNISEDDSVNTSSILMSESELNTVFYPNPVNQTLFIKFTASNSSKIYVSIVSLQGPELISRTYTVNTGENTITIPVSDLNRGIYLCRINNNGKTIIQKIIKQ